MNTEERRGAQQSMLEKHLQTGIQVILVAMLMWAGVQLVNIGQQSVVLEERLTNQAALLQDMRLELRRWGDIYYRRADAVRDLDTLETRIQKLDSRVSDIEGNQ